MHAGVSTSCFYPELTEIAFDYLVDHGIKTLEIFINCQMELQMEFLLPIKQKAEANGVTIVGLHPCTSAEEGRYFFGLYPRRLDESRKLYENYYLACNLLEVDSLVFHGAWVTPFEDDRYIERLELLRQDAWKYGVHLCLENVWRFRSQSLEMFKKIRSTNPKAKFILDTKQAILSGYQPEEFIAAMGGENIHHVHISDNSYNKPCQLPGDGDFDLQGFFRKLKQAGFDGPVILELYRDNYQEYAQLIEASHYLENILCELSK